MNKKKMILKTYFTIFLFVVSFFTIYAFRNDALNMLYSENDEMFRLKEHEKNELIQKISAIEPNIASRNIIAEIIKPYENRFAFNIIAYDEKGPVSATSSLFTINGSMSRESTERQDVIEFNSKDRTKMIFTYPILTDFYKMYCIFALFTSALLCLLFLFIIRFEERHHLFQKMLKRVFGKLPQKTFHKLSAQLLIVNILSGALALGCFFFMYQNRYAFFDFLNDFYKQDEIVNKMASNIEKEFADISLDKKNKVNATEILRSEISSEMNAYIFDETELYYIGVDDSNATSNFYHNGIYDVSSIIRGSGYNYVIQTKDQYATLTIYYYPLAKFVIPFMFVIVLLSLTLYLIPLLYFINQKVKNIKVMQDDIEILANGDWNHKVHMIGEDEIAELGNYLNQMRVAFIDNREKERQAIHANKELITSLSHDIRTPLTSLLGYLDIIRLNKYKDETQYHLYLQNCIEKVQQINALSNKTFEYALVFEVEDEFERELIDVQSIAEYIEGNIDYLHLQGYQVKSDIQNVSATINGNMIMIQRIINNLFSNIMKYADKEKDTIITFEQEKNILKLKFANEKSGSAELIESNHIGLKSVKRMVELHKGEIFVNNLEDSFIVVISIPIHE